MHALALPICILLAATLPAQTPEPTTPAALTAAFAALAPAAQEAVLQRIEARLAASDDELLQRARGFAASLRTPLPEPPPRTWHDPAEFAPVAPARTVLRDGDPRHRRTREEFPAVPFVRGAQPAVRYDQASGQVVRADPPPDAAARFAAILAGRPPEVEAAIAVLERELDVDADQRELARWFEHLYADRDGRVFAGITLYEAWASGKTVEVPDVDAIAYARRVVHTDAFVSPIPAGRRRDRLYAQIQDGFARHRTYRTLREAAAVAAVAADPQVDPTYAELLPRMHLLWAVVGDDPAAMASRLAAGSRADLLDSIDATLREDPRAAAVVEERRRTGRQTLAEIRRIAAEELRNAR